MRALIKRITPCAERPENLVNIFKRSLGHGPVRKLPYNTIRSIRRMKSCAIHGAVHGPGFVKARIMLTIVTHLTSWRSCSQHVNLIAPVTYICGYQVGIVGEFFYTLSDASTLHIYF